MCVVLCVVLSFSRPSALWINILYRFKTPKRQRSCRTLGTASAKYWMRSCKDTTEITVRNESCALYLSLLPLVLKEKVVFSITPASLTLLLCSFTSIIGPNAPIHSLPEGAPPPGRQDNNNSLAPSRKVKMDVCELKNVCETVRKQNPPDAHQWWWIWYYF